MKFKAGDILVLMEKLPCTCSDCAQFKVGEKYKVIQSYDEDFYLDLIPDIPLNYNFEGKNFKLLKIPKKKLTIGDLLK